MGDEVFYNDKLDSTFSDLITSQLYLRKADVMMTSSRKKSFIDIIENRLNSTKKLCLFFNFNYI